MVPLQEAQGLTLAPIDAARAARAIAGIERLDPTGMGDASEVEAVTRNGRCFELSGAAANAVYVVHVRNGVAWVDALQGSGHVDVSVLVAGLLEQQAAGLDAIAFQTARRGLVRKAPR